MVLATAPFQSHASAARASDAAAMKVKPAAVPTNPFPQWLLDADNAVKSWGKRVSARSELAEPFLMTTHEHGAAEEGRVASFLRDHTNTCAGRRRCRRGVDALIRL